MASTAISCVVTHDEGRGGGTVMPGWEKCEAGRGRGGLARIHCKAGA